MKVRFNLGLGFFLQIVAKETQRRTFWPIWIFATEDLWAPSHGQNQKYLQATHSIWIIDT